MSTLLAPSSSVDTLCRVQTDEMPGIVARWLLADSRATVDRLCEVRRTQGYEWPSVLSEELPELAVKAAGSVPDAFFSFAIHHMFNFVSWYAVAVKLDELFSDDDEARMLVEERIDLEDRIATMEMHAQEAEYEYAFA